MRSVDWLWSSPSATARIARAALTPAELAMRAIVSVRNSRYDRGASAEPPIPVVSVGNLTVGGTGKTPIAAWLARKLGDAGASPCLVLRGYGDDEPLVHAVLNPAVPIIVSPDRARGVADGAACGADVAVLDDAFQHRALDRTADIVLVAADDWSRSRRLLPAGPWREPLESLARADLVVITRKAASNEQMARAEREIASAASGVPVAVARLDVGDLLRFGAPDERMPAAQLKGRSTLAIAAVGNPAAFFAQLRSLGATVTARPYRDHHRFTERDAVALAAESARHELTVCTLKDAVKLAPIWPANAPSLWYVSQPVQLERGAEHVDRIIGLLLSRKPQRTT